MRQAGNLDARSRNRVLDLFEFIALTWDVELRRFEPRTSCMPYTHDPSRVIARGRPEWI
jgi:hypothetical protein